MTDLTAFPLWIAPQPLILASTSQTRRAMVAAAGICAEARDPAVDERAVEDAFRTSGAPVDDLALLLAREKALAVSRREPGRLVLGADQTLECEGTLFHKPVNRDGARAQLAALAGREHHLHAAAALAQDGKVVFETVDTAGLTVREMQDGFIETYLDAMGDAVLRSVGGYQVEGLGIQLFSRIDGNHFTILGLPLLPILQFLREAGFLAR